MKKKISNKGLYGIWCSFQTINIINVWLLFYYYHFWQVCDQCRKKLPIIDRCFQSFWHLCLPSFSLVILPYAIKNKMKKESDKNHANKYRGKLTCLRSSLLRSSSAFLSSLFTCVGINAGDVVLCASAACCATWLSELLSSTNKSKSIQKFQSTQVLITVAVVW